MPPLLPSVCQGLESRVPLLHHGHGLHELRKTLMMGGLLLFGEVGDIHERQKDACNFARKVFRGETKPPTLIRALHCLPQAPTTYV